jgi:hypothetical protein
MSDISERRRAREATWAGGVARSFAEMDTIDLAFWQRAAAAERLQTVWSLVEDALALQGNDGPPPRLQRLVGGVRALKG